MEHIEIPNTPARRQPRQFVTMPRILFLGLVLSFSSMFGYSSETGNAGAQKSQKQVNENAELADSAASPFISDKQATAFQEAGFVRYSDFGAKGDRNTDDLAAIVATHAYANRHELAVKADEGASYYIGGAAQTAVIQTDTYFGDASFLIDDTDVQDRNAPVFVVASELQAFELTGLTSLRKNQSHIEVDLPGPCLITVTDSNTKRYIRFGPNQNSGAAQTDIFVVDKDGYVDADAPIIWDFDQISEIHALPIDETPLTLTGGHFITKANQAESKYTYYKRNLSVKRSNVSIDGLRHEVIGEGQHGAPYAGFISVSDCSYVTVKNTVLTGRKTYRTIGSAGRAVNMGSYDILVNRALNVSFVNCSQTNSIHDRTYWGIMGSNFSKNLVYDNCTFSRFDAHMGVANATIRNSTLGHMGINAIGTGTLLVENSTVHARSLVNLRPDYGSTWEGTFVIRDSHFVPTKPNGAGRSLIYGHNSTKHDFGYTCHMPHTVMIENLFIDDSKLDPEEDELTVFSNVTPEKTSAAFTEDFPYIRTKKLILENVVTASGRKLPISPNPLLFSELSVVRND